jgi:hypothetical protein
MMNQKTMKRMMKVAAIGILALGVFGFVFMALWNWLIPSIFGLHTIDFWQALGIFILSKLLFGGFHGGPGRGRWDRRLKERWEQMTPEEREKFRQGMAGRCGPGAPEQGLNAT